MKTADITPGEIYAAYNDRSWNHSSRHAKKVRVIETKAERITGFQRKLTTGVLVEDAEPDRYSVTVGNRLTDGRILIQPRFIIRTWADHERYLAELDEAQAKAEAAQGAARLERAERNRKILDGLDQLGIAGTHSDYNRSRILDGLDDPKVDLDGLERLVELALQPVPHPPAPTA